MTYDPVMSELSSAPTLSLLDLVTNRVLPLGQPDVVVEIPDTYLTDERLERPGVEGIAIQRLLTLAQQLSTICFVWDQAAARRVLASPAVHPLASVALCLNNATHVCEGGDAISKDAFERARQSLVSHRLGADMFSERQVLISLDYQRPSLPFDLYEPSSRRLRREEEFESLVDDLLFAQRGAGFRAEMLPKFRLPIAIILRELIENTDDHARTDFDGSTLKPNAVRCLLVKRIEQEQLFPAKKENKDPPVPCLEFTIIDSGIGYYNSYRRQLLRGQARGAPVKVGDTQADTIRQHELGSNVPLDLEYAILLKCLERHSENAIPDPRPGHRGMGLYEVLRALKMMRGLFEVRTGRIHGYRSFLEGEARLQLESDESKTRPGMPKASLLDMSSRFWKKPTPHELVRGSVVRVVVPLI